MKHSNPDRLIFFLGAICLLICLSYGLFGERPFDIEEFAHFNIPYMVANYSKASFPIYYNWNQVYVHPPTHYFFIGKLLKVFSLHYVLIIVPLFFISTAIYFSVTSKINIALKSGFVLAVYCFVITCLNTTVNFSVRPDMCYTLCWIAGLLGLEKSRRDNWNLVSLAGGSVFLSLASIYHYPATPALFGFLVCIVAAKMDLQWTPFFKRFAVIGFFACAVGIPFLVLYAIPNFQEIYSYLIISNAENSPLKNVWETFVYHLNYHSRVNSNWLGYFYREKIPLGFLSIIGLVVLPPTRFLSLAASPVILFLTFIVKTKRDYYLLPEWAVFYFFLFALVAFMAVKLLPRRNESKTFERICVVSALVIVLFTFLWSPKLKEMLEAKKSRQYHTIEVARAVAQTITGNDALVGGIHGIWYLSGARYWYNEDRELVYKFNEDLDVYLSRSDYFADYAFGKYGDLYAMGGTFQRMSALYVNGHLSLKAVIFHKDFSYCMYSATHTDLNGFQMFIHDKDSVRHFVAAGQGDYVMASFLCSSIDSSLSLNKMTEAYVLYLTQLGLSDPQQVIYFACAKENLEKVKNLLGEKWSEKEIYTASCSILSHGEFLKQHPYNPKENFYLNQEKAINRESRYQMN